MTKKLNGATNAMMAHTRTSDTIETEIRKMSDEYCTPQYHEYHRATNEHGFIKMTIPGKGRRGGFR